MRESVENRDGPPRDRAPAARVEGRKTTRDGSKMGGTRPQPSHTKQTRKSKMECAERTHDNPDRTIIHSSDRRAKQTGRPLLVWCSDLDFNAGHCLTVSERICPFLACCELSNSHVAGKLDSLNVQESIRKAGIPFVRIARSAASFH